VARPLLALKTYVPKAGRALVPRSRLLERFSQSSSARLTLVCAPPGFGKTTLIAEWARTVEGRVAWLSLDPEDNDRATFWAYVVMALGAVVPGIKAMEQELAAAGIASSRQAATTLLNEMSEGPEVVWLVLDDYHLVVDPDVRDGVTYLVEHLPPHVHIVLGTRQDPDLPLPRWRVRGELVEIRAADLRFTRDEAADYLQSATGLDLTIEQVSALDDRAEGWIAALQLAGLSLRGSDDADGFIDRFTGDDRYVVDYLMDEVLTHQPEDVREFLLLTSILERLSADLCDAVTGLGNGSAMLSALDRANLFVVPLDSTSTWFRYHHLFADVLGARLLADRAADVPALHGLASRWCEDNGMSDEAIRHALAAQDFDRASSLVEGAVAEARRARRDTTLIRWLESLPEDVIRRSPVLTVFHGWSRISTGDLDLVESHLDHASDLLASGPSGTAWADTDALRTLPATIAIYRASLAQARGDLPGVAAQAREALDLAGPRDHLTRGAAGGFLALAAWSAGDVLVAIETFTRAVASLHSAGNLVDELSSTALLAEMWTVAGRPSKARELCRRALIASEALGIPAARASADLHVQLAELDLDAGDQVSADDHLKAALPLAAYEPASESRYRWFVVAARLAASRADHARAVALLDEADEHYRAGFYPNVRPIAAMRARVWIATGELDKAADWVADRELTTADEPSYLKEYEHLTMVRLLLEQHPRGSEAVTEVRELLGRLEGAAEHSGRNGSLAEVRSLLALTAPVGREDSSSSGGLTSRELEVLRLLDSELTAPQIAKQLFVSHNTLRTHTKHIFTKLDVTTRRAAVARGRERGLIADSTPEHHPVRHIEG
jgi:LuxR family maltose regulon positive regulatory protein